MRSASDDFLSPDRSAAPTNWISGTGASGGAGEAVGTGDTGVVVGKGTGVSAGADVAVGSSSGVGVGAIGVVVGKGTGVSAGANVAVGSSSGVGVGATGVWAIGVGVRMGAVVGGVASLHDDSKAIASKHRSPPKVSRVASRAILVRRRELGNNEAPRAGTRYYHGARLG